MDTVLAGKLSWGFAALTILPVLATAYVYWRKFQKIMAEREELERELGMYHYAISEEGMKDRLLETLKQLESEPMGTVQASGMRHELPESTPERRLAFTYQERFEKSGEKQVTVYVIDENGTNHEFRVALDDPASVTEFVRQMMEVERGIPTSDY